MFETPKEIVPTKRAYYENLAFSRLPEMRLLFRGGKLWQKDKWRNVIEHQIVQLAAAKEIATALELPEAEQNRLLKAALCHDWDKRLKIKPGDFTDEEKAAAQEFLRKVGPDKNLISATGPEFIEMALVKKQSTFLERLAFYLDDIAKGSEIVDFDERIAEVETRRQDLNDNTDLTQKLGGRYWDKERELGHQVEQEIFEVLKAKGIFLQSPRDIPRFVREKIESHYSAKI